ELALGAQAICALAERPRLRPPTLAPPAHAGLAAHVQHLLSSSTPQEARQAAQHQLTQDHRIDPALRDVLPISSDGDAPLCVRRLLALPAPDGSSNMPLINLLAYWRRAGVTETGAVERATAWLLRGVSDPHKRAERCGSARSVGQAVY